MSRLLDITRRDLSGWVLLALALALVAMITPGLGAPPESAEPAAGASPLLPLVVYLADSLPSVRTWSGSVPLFSLGLIWLSALGIFYCTWRLTRNRVVSLGAGLLISIHPLAMRAAFQPAGLRDIVGLAILSWLLVLNAKPRARSTRFPNLPPSASSKPLIALMFLGILTAPGFWIVPLILFAMDIPFHREAGRGAFERNWRSYAPHHFCLFLGFVLEFTFGSTEGTVGVIQGVGGFADTCASVFFPGTEHGVFSASVVVLVVIAAAVVGIFEALFDLGRRRLTLPYVAFAGFASAVSLIGAIITADARVTGASWVAFIGFAILIPVVAWRMMMSFLPEQDTHINLHSLPHRPSWDEILHNAHLAPVPELANVPAGPRLEDWSQNILTIAPLDEPETVAEPVTTRNDLQGALDRLGLSLPVAGDHSAKWDADFYRQELEPFLNPSASVLAFLPSRSPYAAMSAALCRRMTILEQGTRGFPGITGFDNVSLFEYDGRRPWPAGGESSDVIFSMGVLSRIRTPELQGALSEFARILKPNGVAILVFQHMGTLDDAESNPLPEEVAADFCREAGFTVESIAEAVEGSYRILARRGVV
ncbi:MAG: hypothetical protein ACI97A_000533 [Planctomycetota bacterium]|jgi:hypothetical protein